MERSKGDVEEEGGSGWMGGGCGKGGEEGRNPGGLWLIKRTSPVLEAVPPMFHLLCGANWGGSSS